MRAQIEVLREVFEEWLRIHEVNYDVWFYTPAEWEVKEGPDHLLKRAELMIAFDNRLTTWMNFGTSVPDELQELAEGFGYYYELGHHWNMGFYPIDDWPALPSGSATYTEKLEDPRWLRKRERILERCGHVCEECGVSLGLEVHHCYYRYGREPWQYPDTALLALCRTCHKQRAKIEMDFRLFQQSLRTEEIRAVQTMLDHCKYWYSAAALQTFLKALHHAPGDVPIGGTPGAPQLTPEEHEQLKSNAQYGELCAKLYQMLQTNGHPEDRSEPRTRGRF
jgi:hypothetical protein